MNYIPNNPRDMRATKYLHSLPFDTIRNDVPKLLGWLQDMHWPVAPPIAVYLGPHLNEITQDLLAVLDSDDTMWKYWIIQNLLDYYPGKLPDDIINTLKRIAVAPTAMEADDTVDEVARDLLNKINIKA